MGLLYNYPLWAALVAIVVAQSIKVMLHWWALRKWDWQLLFSTGGMPSSHSASVVALTTAIGIQEGLESPFFAISAIFSIIIMFDAAGIRRHAGEHAAVLNQLLEELKHITQIDWSHPEKGQEKLKELLGHKPTEVFAGGWLGFFTALAMNAWAPF